MSNYEKVKYEKIYNELSIDSLSDIGFGRSYIHDYYVSGYYPPTSVMEEIKSEKYNEIASNMQGETGLYFHYPACSSKCIYCHYYYEDYNCFKPKEADYVDSMCKEMGDFLKGKDTNISFVYFGGGTPSLYSNESLQKLSEAIKSKCSVLPNAEIRFEIYPNKYPKEELKKKLEALKQLGVTTIIMDMQSLEQKVLKGIGRDDTSEENFINLINTCEEAGFDDFHSTLLIGLPYQTWDVFSENLKRMVEIPNINLINTFVIFNKAGDSYRTLKNKNTDIFPSDKETDMMLLFAREYLNDNGFEEGPLYFFYRKGTKEKYRSIRNVKNYIGFGAAGQSLLRSGDNEFYYFNIPDYERYIEKINNNQKAVWLGKLLDKEGRFVKNFISSLYNRTKVDVYRFRKKYAINAVEYYSDSLKLLKECKLIEYNNYEIRFTPQGILRAERVIYFFATEKVRIENDKCFNEYEYRINNKHEKHKLDVGKYSYFPTLSKNDKMLLKDIKDKLGLKGLECLDE